MFWDGLCDPEKLNQYFSKRVIDYLQLLEAGADSNASRLLHLKQTINFISTFLEIDLQSPCVKAMLRTWDMKPSVHTEMLIRTVILAFGSFTVSHGVFTGLH